MKKFYALSLSAFLALPASAQIAVNTAIVPQYMQGVNGTNNNRTPMWFWADISGLTPGATYRYYTTVDTLNASPTSNGAGNPYLVNMLSSTFRRTTNASLTNSAGHDSLTANVSGNFSGWFGVEPTGNGRFTPGTVVYPKFMFNNGAGGTSVATRVLLSADPITVINYGTTPGAALEGSALYDSAASFAIAPKDFALLYDNTSGAGRPLSIAVVEDDGMDLFAVTSIANFYRTLVDTMPQRWGTIMPNANTNGVRLVEYRDFANGGTLTFGQFSDNNGVWCSGTNTVDPSNGSTAVYLDENFSLFVTGTFPDTTYTLVPTSFSANSNGTGVMWSWDFGDGSPLDTNQNPQHTYTLPGTYTVTVIAQAPNCGVSYNDTIVVLLGTDVKPNGAAANAFSIAPNPGDGDFTLQLHGSGNKTVTVLNLLGEQVLETRSSGSTLRLDLNGQAKGVYLVRVRDENGRALTKKLVIR